jgi:hypothetical protein
MTSGLAETRRDGFPPRLAGRDQASHGLREPLPGPPSWPGRGYWVAVRAPSRTPAVVPMYMFSMMR